MPSPRSILGAAMSGCVLGAALAVPATGVSNPTGTAETATATPTVSVRDARFYEGTIGRREFTVPVCLSGRPSGVVSVGTETEPLNASADSDFRPTRSRIAWGPGEDLCQRIGVWVTADRTGEADERLRVRLTAPEGLRIGDGSAVVTIDDDDGGPGKRANAAKDEIVIPGPWITIRAFDFTAYYPSPRQCPEGTQPFLRNRNYDRWGLSSVNGIDVEQGQSGTPIHADLSRPIRGPQQTVYFAFGYGSFLLGHTGGLKGGNTMTNWSGSAARIRVILHCTSDVEYASNTGWGYTGGRD